MDKNRKLTIALSITAGVLVVVLIVLAILFVLSGKPDIPGKEDTELSDTGTGDITTDEPVVSADSIATTDGTEMSDITDDESTEHVTDISTTESAPTEDPDTGIIFREVNEQVTAKIEVNLRYSTYNGDDDNIVCTLLNGDVAVRTGVHDSGWSRVEYNGQTLYCVSSYLTTDLDYTPPAAETDAFKTKFTPVNEKVTAKEVTNLRDIPSVMEPSKVIVQLNHGEVAIRTGVANEGWSRVEYDGKVLYCISSYLEVIEGN